MVIKNIEKLTISEYSVLQGKISFNNSELKKIFIAVPKEFGDFLDETSADPFIISFIQIACKYDENIVVEDAQVSKELSDNIENILIPTLAKIGFGSGKTKIIAKKIIEDKINNNKIGATGISCGVDSFYAILSNLKENNKEFPIHACVIICGCKGLEKINNNILKAIATRKEICDKLSLKFIPVFTNLNSIITLEFNNVFEKYHTFYRVGVMSSLKKKMGYYYYATGYNDENMKLDAHSTAFYENIIRNVINYNTFKMFSSGNKTSRFNKTKYIAFNKIVQEYLDVCINNSVKKEKVNCSYCFKCIRTLVTLDILKIIDEYSKTFDLSLYKKNRNKFLGSILYKYFINKDILAKDIYYNAKLYNFKFPLMSYLYIIIIGFKNQINKLKKRL